MQFGGGVEAYIMVHEILKLYHSLIKLHANWYFIFCYKTYIPQYHVLLMDLFKQTNHWDLFLKIC
jgi:hypothetical protein